MRARVVELEYAKIPRPLQLLPDEIVRRGLDDDVDVVYAAQPVDEACGAIERIGEVGVSVSEPGDAHQQSVESVRWRSAN